MTGTTDQRAASWARLVSRSVAITTASIGKGRRLKSIMNINENMVDLLSEMATVANELQS
jgi:hypothetical protein